MIYQSSSKISRYIYLKEIPSTNAYIAGIISKSKPQHDFCAYTYNQTEGRGQIGRKWFSDHNKNICLSILVQHKDLEVHRQFELNMAVCLGILEYIKMILGPGDVKIKWPNDIYFKDQKLAGILIQNQISGQYISSSIIGVGLNVNQILFPDDIPNPTSLRLIKQKKFNLFNELTKLSENIYDSINYFKEQPQNLFEKYINSIYGIHQIRQFKDQDNHIFKGIIKGINPSGQLLVEVENKILKFNFREIGFIH